MILQPNRLKSSGVYPGTCLISYDMIKLYPYEKRRFSTSLPSDEIKDRLRSYVEKTPSPAYDLYAPHAGSTFFGLVEEDSFQMYRTQLYNTRPTTLVRGKVRTNPENGRSEVELVYQLTFFTRLFFFLWHGLFLLAAISLVLYRDDYYVGVVFPLLFMFVGNRLVMVPYGLDIKYMEEFFTRSLQAQWSSSKEVSEMA
jgi:hypothetical protein